MITAGKYSVKSVKSISFKLPAISKVPTMTSSAEMTANGINAINGINKIVNKKYIPTKKDVNPLFPPTVIPVAFSALVQVIL